jgi:hypothetical protein
MEEEFDVMKLRHRFLKKEVKIVDGSDEDGNFGLVIGVTARSAEPLTVLFWTLGTVRHVNYYRPIDLVLTGGVFSEGKEPDQTVRCRKSRFDGLWRVIDGRGPHEPGAGTQGIAWNHYLKELADRLSGKEECGEADTDREVAGTARQDRPVVGAADGNELQRNMEVGEGCVAASAGERTETEEVNRT